MTRPRSHRLDHPQAEEHGDRPAGKEDPVELQLSLSCNVAGFTLCLPLTGGGAARQQARAAAAPPPAGPEAAPAGGEVPADVLRLQQLLVARDPGLLARLEATGEAPDVAFFTRWLIARKGNVEAAAAGIAAHADWRVEFWGLDGGVTSLERFRPAPGGGGSSGAGPGSGGWVLEEGAVPLLGQAPSDKVFLQGADNAGQAVVVVKAGKQVLSSRDLPQTKRLICYALDNAFLAADAGLNPLGRVCCMFDLSGLSVRELDAKALSSIFELLQQHYPERLARLYFLNAPFLFWGVWSVVSPFLDPKTRTKIQFVSKKAAKLREQVPPDVLPAEFGGEAELQPLEVAVAQLRSERGRALRAAAAAAAEGAGAEAWPGRWAWLGAGRRRVAGGARRAGRFLAVRVGRPARRAAKAAAGAAGAAFRRLRAAHKTGRLSYAGALPLWRNLLAPSLLLSMLRVAGQALARAGRSARRRLKAE